MFMLSGRHRANLRWSPLLLLSTCALLGCSTQPSASSSGDSDGQNREAGGGSKTLRIAVVPKGTSHQFWRSVHAGAVAGAKELGNVEVIWKGPETEADTAGQISVVKNFITSRVDGIVLAPNHSQALVDVVTEAVAEEIPVVVFDSGLAAGAELVSYVATDNLRGGQLAGETLAAAMNEQGAVILIRYKAGSESTEQREQGFLEVMAQKPNIKVLSSDQYGGTSTEESMAVATNLLNKYHDQVTGIFAVNESSCNGTFEALVQTGLAGKVKFVGFDASDSLIKGLSENTVAGIVLQDPFEMGRKSVLSIVAHVRGDPVEPNINTGEYVATAENQETEPYNRLLRPALFGQ